MKLRILFCTIMMVISWGCVFSQSNQSRDSLRAKYVHDNFKQRRKIEDSVKLMSMRSQFMTTYEKGQRKARKEAINDDPAKTIALRYKLFSNFKNDSVKIIYGKKK